MLVIGWILSSNKNEDIKAVLFFKRKDFTRTIKHQKHKTQASNFHSDVFHAHKKHKKYKKAQNVKQAIFFLDILYAHKNAVFFVLHTKKHKKHIKSTKTQISE